MSNELRSIRVRNIENRTESVGFDAAPVSVFDLKTRIEEVFEVPVQSQRLIYAGRELYPDSAGLLSFKINDNGVIHLMQKKMKPSVVYGSEEDVSHHDSEDSQLEYSNDLEEVMHIYRHLIQSNSEDVERMLHMTFRLALLIMFFSTLDCLYTIFWSVLYPCIIPVITFPILGYWSARNLSVKLFAIYLSSNFLRASLYIFCAFSTRLDSWIFTNDRQVLISLATAHVITGVISVAFLRHLIPLRESHREYIRSLLRPSLLNSHGELRHQTNPHSHRRPSP